MEQAVMTTTDYESVRNELASLVQALHDNIRRLADVVLQVQNEHPEWRESLIAELDMPRQMWHRLVMLAEDRLDERLVLESDRLPAAVRRLCRSEQQLLLDGKAEMLIPGAEKNTKRVSADELVGNKALEKQLIVKDRLRTLREQRSYLETLPLQSADKTSNAQPQQAENWDVVGRGKKARVEIRQPVELTYKQLRAMMDRLDDAMGR